MGLEVVWSALPTTEGPIPTERDFWWKYFASYYIISFRGEDRFLSISAQESLVE